MERCGHLTTHLSLDIYISCAYSSHPPHTTHIHTQTHRKRTRRNHPPIMQAMIPLLLPIFTALTFAAPPLPPYPHVMPKSDIFPLLPRQANTSTSTGPYPHSTSPPQYKSPGYKGYIAIMIIWTLGPACIILSVCYFYWKNHWTDARAKKQKAQAKKERQNDIDMGERRMRSMWTNEEVGGEGVRKPERVVQLGRERERHSEAEEA